MSTFMTTLPKRSKSMGNKKKSPVMTLKPCADEKTYYRVRLLAFSPSKASGSDRDYPFIKRFVHQHWSKHPEKGYPVLDDEVICPVTPHVHVEGNRYDACKICTLANKYFITFKESGWKDKDANRKNKEYGRKYQYIVPVYCVQNPNWEGDDNKFKVIIFNDKKFAEEFQKKVERASQTACVFNGVNAVDCCIHVKEEIETINPGQPNEYTFKKKVIDKVVFSNQPYDIPAIDKDAIENGENGPMGFDFDDEYYTSSTPEEIEAFYKKYCTISNDDIPDEDDIPVYDQPVSHKPVEKVEVSNTEASPSNDISLDDLNDLTSDPDDIPAENPAVAQVNTQSDDIDAEKLIASLDL